MTWRAGLPLFSGVFNSATTNYVTGLYYWPNNVPSSLTRGNGLQLTTQLTNRDWYSCGIETMVNPPSGSHNSSGSELWNGCLGWNTNGTAAWHAFNNAGAGYSGLQQFADFYTYDNINRLKSVNDTLNTGTQQNQVWTTQYTQNFSFDNYGNIWFPGATGNTPSTDAYSATNNQNSSWSYDGAGNLKTINGNAASYNLENEMTSIATSGAQGRHPDRQHHDTGRPPSG